MICGDLQVDLRGGLGSDPDFYRRARRSRKNRGCVGNWGGGGVRAHGAVGPVSARIGVVGGYFHFRTLGE